MINAPAPGVECVFQYNKPFTYLKIEMSPRNNSELLSKCSDEETEQGLCSPSYTAETQIITSDCTRAKRIRGGKMMPNYVWNERCGTTTSTLFS